MNNKNKLLVFGSLRKNSKRGFNFNRFGGQEYVKDVVLNGFDMYDLGPYPAICEGKGQIKCEMHNVSDTAFAMIRMMERGAGYSEKVIEIDGEKATIFTMTPESMEMYGIKGKPMKVGDWR